MQPPQLTQLAQAEATLVSVGPQQPLRRVNQRGRIGDVLLALA